ncbi:MAG: FHA domain-containing protein [Actinobacteria bacterium]|nr:FHA domain-containing protein [Actinomycetota bacterium]
MLELQVPLLAAKALLLLLLFAFVYAVVRRGVGDLRRVPDEGTHEPVSERNGHGGYQGAAGGRPASMAEFVVEDSDVMAPETRFPVKSGTTTLGRSSASDIILKSDDYASGRHALLTRHGGLLYVEDAGSTNGTYVNGRKTVGATPLRNGDTVRVGSTTFRYVE